MNAQARWGFPVFPRSELDQQILHLCRPIPRAASCEIEPNGLLERAAALGVFPLVFHRLRQSAPAGTAGLRSEWEERFRENAARNLYLHSEQQQLLARWAAAGILAVPLKGTLLAERAYGDLSLRSQADLDFYVPGRQLRKAVEAIAAGGFRQIAPVGVEPDRLAATGDEFASECSLLSTAGNVPVLVELHWHILPLPEAELRAALTRSSATGAGGDWLFLPPELNHLYLCLKAGANRWGTLKQLVDLAHLLTRQPCEWEPLLATAQRLGLRRALYLTLAALHTYFGWEAPEPVRAALEPARPRRLPAAAVADPFSPPTAVSPAATHRLRLGLHERFRDRARYAARLLRPTAADLAAVHLPRPLGFLYWGVRWLRMTGILKDTWKREPIGAHI